MAKSCGLLAGILLCGFLSLIGFAIGGVQMLAEHPNQEGRIVNGGSPALFFGGVGLGLSLAVAAVYLLALFIREMSRPR